MTRMHFVGTHVIDIDDLNTFPKKELYEKESRSAQIHKLNWNVRDQDKKDYEPSHLSIGPYHHGNPALRAMENAKWVYLNYLLELNQEKTLQDYLKAVKEIEGQARSFYADEIKMDRKSFVEMLLLDACFILMTLKGTDAIQQDIMTRIKETDATMSENTDQSVNIDVDENTQSIQTNVNDGDNSYKTSDMLTKIFWRDVLLLENQIPFFVIIKVYAILTRGRNPISSLVRNVLQSMEGLFGYHPETIHKYHPSKEIYHLLHLFHLYFKPSQRGEENCQSYLMRPVSFHNFLYFGSKLFKKNEQNMSYDNGDKNIMARQQPSYWRRGTQYHEARIDMKIRKFSSDNPHSLLDIRFNNGTLEIPCLNIIEPNFFTLLKNLVAFEQIYPQFENYYTSYAIFWSQFVTTPDDVALLVDKGIIRHVLHTDNEVASLFKSLADNVFFDFNGHNYLKSICHLMEACYQVGRPKWKEWFDSIKSRVSDWPRYRRSELPITLPLRE